MSTQIDCCNNYVIQNNIPVIFSGTSSLELSKNIVSHIDLPIGKANISRFSDGEVNVEINENVRGRDVFIIQSTCFPTNESIMELLIMTDALRRASVGRISAVIPYFGYARQDRRPRYSRVPISAKLVANLIQNVGISRLITMDLHADQIQGFFDIPVDNIYASPVFIKDLQANNIENLIFVSPDIGGVGRARSFAKYFGAELAIIDKRRPKPNESEVLNIIGDVENKTCVIVDDIIDTAGTLIKAAEALHIRGASKVMAYCTHPILSGLAIERINNSEYLDNLVVSDTIPLSSLALTCGKIRQVSVSFLIAQTILRMTKGQSVISLLEESNFINTVV